MPIFEFDFAYPLGSQDEPQILAMLIKLQFLVEEQAEGKFTANWEKTDTSQIVYVSISVAKQSFQQAIDVIVDDLENLLNRGLLNHSDDQEGCSKDEDNCPSESNQSNHDEQASCWEPDEEELERSMEDSDSLQHQPDESQDKTQKKRNQQVKKNEGTKSQGQNLSPVHDNISHEDTQGNEEKKLTAPGTESRRKIACPLPSCSARVVHLPRHMRTVHKWTSEASKKVLLRFNIRKKKAQGETGEFSKKKKDYHRRRRCPVDNCQSIVFRLSAHLTKVHKMKRTSPTYKQLLSAAYYVPDRIHPLIRWGREMKNKKSSTRNDNVAELKKTCSEECMATTSVDEGSQQSNGSSDEELISPSESSDIGENTSVNQLDEDVNNPVLEQYKNWLCSPDGGKKDEKTAKQHQSQLMSILNVIDKTANITSLLDVKLIRTEFLKKHVEAKKYEAATIKSYLMSLRHFFSFLLADEPSHISFDPHSLRATRDKVKMWSASYKRESCTRRWMKLEEDSQNQLTPADIRKFERSEAARRAITLLGQFSELTSREVSQMSYTLIRDFLFAQIFTDNANRPGVLSHMTMTEYNNMRKEDGEWIISVLHHKTVHIHGPAYIVLSSKLKSWLDIFVNRMRSQVTSSKKGAVFLSWNGQNLESCQINRAIQSIFKKAGLSTKVTSTSFRKAAVTTVHTKTPELGDKLANLMAHDKGTAKKYYLLTEKSKASVEASKKLRNLMRDHTTDTVKPSNDCTVTDEPSTSSRKQQLPSKERKPWTQQEVDKVKDAFKQEIQEQSVTLEAVKRKIEIDPELTGISPKRVYDRLRKELHNNQQNAGPETREILPEDLKSESLEERVQRMDADESNTCEQESSLGIAPPTENSSKLFQDSDLSTIRTLFADMIENKSISMKEIKKRCTQDADGKRLLTNKSVTQVMNRVKYERRMKKGLKE